MTGRGMSARRGAMLLELLVSSVIIGIIVLGLHASIAVSLRSMPTADSPGQIALETRRIVDRMAAEFETAIFVFERTSTTLGMTVADRDGDGKDERIRYAWTGTPGGPLTRKYNNESPATLVSSVQNFSLTAAYTVVSDPYPAVCVEDATESMLVDNYASSGTSNNTVSSSNWYGQHFVPTLPANAYAWRPTRVQVMAKTSNGFLGFSWAQIRAATGGVTPSSTVLNQWYIADGALPNNYEWQQYSFSNVDQLPGGGAICFVQQHSLGTSSGTLQSRSGLPGRLRTTNGGTSWTYDSSNALNSRLYGKYFVSNGTQYTQSKYLMSLKVSLQLRSTSAAIQTVCPALNHPELCTGLWELKFDRNPKTLDVNGDGSSDWTTSVGNSFDMASISNGVWTTSSVALRTWPLNDFNGVTIIELRCRNTSVGGKGATFTINPLRSGSTCASLEAGLALQSDGTQTLTISHKASDISSATLLNLAGLPPQMIDLRLIIDPATQAVSIKVNGVQRGTFPIARFTSSDSTRYAAIGPNGSQAEFSYARIRMLEP